MPYGAIYLDSFNASDLTAKIIFQFGSDKRLVRASNFPSQGTRQITQLTQIDQSLLRGFSNLTDATITQGVRTFPQYVNTKLDIPFGGLIGNILYPFGVSFLLPIFVIILVKEKEDKM